MVVVTTYVNAYTLRTSVNNSKHLHNQGGRLQKLQKESVQTPREDVLLCPGSARQRHLFLRIRVKIEFLTFDDHSLLLLPVIKIWRWIIKQRIDRLKKPPKLNSHKKSFFPQVWRM